MKKHKEFTMILLTLAFAQEAQAQQAAPAQQNPLMSMLPIAVIFIIFYFLLIRPQKKQQKEHSEMLTSLKKNDEVVTAGGIHGTIVNLQEDLVTLRIDENTRMKVQKSSISRHKKSQSQ